MSAPVIVIDGVVVPAAQATISVLDRGLLLGDGCFEVLRTWGGVAVDLEAHLDRLLDTAAYLALQGVERGALTAAVARALAAGGEGGEGGEQGASPEHRIRIVVTRGPGSLAAPLASLGPGRTIVIVEPLGPQPTRLSLATVDAPVLARGHGRKTLAYLDHVLARELARAAGADEALRLDARGDIAEGATCNVFAVLAGVVATPATEAGILPGIVRARVLEVCDMLALPTRVGPLSPRELVDADEVFVTSSLRGVVAVTCLDGTPRTTGPVCAAIGHAYARRMTSRQ